MMEITCPNCGGTGKIKSYGEWFGWNYVITYDCPLCDGPVVNVVENQQWTYPDYINCKLPKFYEIGGA